MATTEALVTGLSEQGKPIFVRKQVPLPVPGEHQARVRVSHVAQNPTDVWAFDTNRYGEGAVVGCDFTGVVEEVAPGVTRLSKGDQVAGVIWGRDIKGLGALAQHTLVDERISFKVPDGTSLAEAATVPLASLTSYLALFSDDLLNIDRQMASGEPILIWGGSSSVGLYAIQIAALYGMKVITTCSPKHFDLVRSLGADHVFDYRDANLVASIKDVAPDIKYFFDTIGIATSSETGAQALSEKGATMCTVRPGKQFTENVPKHVKVTGMIMWTAFGQDLTFSGVEFPANKRDHELAVDFCQKLPEYIQSGKIKPNMPKIIPGGLDGVPQGFQEHRDKKISGYKVVYEL